MRAALAAVVLAVAVTGCHGGEETLSVYFPQRLGGDGPHGQISPVLEPVERLRRPHMSARWQALLELRQGPTPSERVRGFAPALEVAERPLDVRVEGGAAIVELAAEPDIYGAAAIVYTLTELRGVDRVGLRVNGRPCCFWLMNGRTEPFADRARYRFWTGEPCELRTDPTHARCRRG